MSATTKELSNKNDFRGDILDRDFPVHYDASTGTYSFDYVESPAELQAALKNIKYYRVSSPTLAELETKLASRIKKEAPAAPRAKGEITKAAEAYQQKYSESTNVLEPLTQKISSGEELTPNEQAAYNKAAKNVNVLGRQATVQQAKKIYNQFQEALNEGIITDFNIRKNLSEDEKTRSKLTNEGREQYEGSKLAIELFARLEILNDLEKTRTLTEEEEREKQEAIEFFEVTPQSLWFKKNIVDIASSKQVSNNARALITQIEGTPENQRSAKQLKNLSNAKAIVRNYETANPNNQRNSRRNEQKRLINIELKRKEIKELNAKPQPLSPTNTEKKRTLQEEVDAFNAEKRAEKPDANEENTTLDTNKNGTNEQERLYGKRELSNEAFQARKTKAQAVLNHFTTNPAADANQTALKTKAQQIINAFTTRERANAKQNEKNVANATIRSSTFLNDARKLGIATGGGKRRTRKAKKSKRKTHKRKH